MIIKESYFSILNRIVEHSTLVCSDGVKQVLYCFPKLTGLSGTGFINIQKEVVVVECISVT